MTEPLVGSIWEIRYKVLGKSRVWDEMFVCEIISGPDRGNKVVFKERVFERASREGEYRHALELVGKVVGSDVIVGQIWVDLDPREDRKRKVKIVAIHRGLSRLGKPPRDYAEVVTMGRGERRSFIRLDRFNPNRTTGYALEEK